MQTNFAHQEQRRFTRVPFVSGITLSYEDKILDGTVVDISLNGLLINCKDFNETADEISASIHFENHSTISAHLKVVHQSSSLYGFRFEDIDSESVAHLRRLLALNLGDESACERELLALFNYHQ